MFHRAIPPIATLTPLVIRTPFPIVPAASVVLLNFVRNFITGLVLMVPACVGIEPTILVLSTPGLLLIIGSGLFAPKCLKSFVFLRLWPVHLLGVVSLRCMSHLGHVMPHGHVHCPDLLKHWHLSHLALLRVLVIPDLARNVLIA